MYKDYCVYCVGDILTRIDAPEIIIEIINIREKMYDVIYLDRLLNSKSSSYGKDYIECMHWKHEYVDDHYELNTDYKFLRIINKLNI